MADISLSPLDPAHIAFLCGGVSISAAACRPGGLPDMARGIGCKVATDGRTVTVLFAATPAAALLDGVRRTGTLAVVFSEPSTHRTVQLKSTDARIVPVESGDWARAECYVDAFVAELLPFGYQEPLIRAFLACEREDLVAVRFTVDAAYSQTPGPNAGSALTAGA